MWLMFTLILMALATVLAFSKRSPTQGFNGGSTSESGQLTTTKTRIETINDFYTDIDDLDLNPEDQHNVHNSSIRRGLKSKINILLRSYQDQSHPRRGRKATIRELRRLGRNDPSIHQTLEYICRHNLQLRPLRLQELDLLVLVWNRIRHTQNRDNFRLLCDELLYQLKDCYQTDTEMICCLDGRVTRILQALESYDFESSVWKTVPLWAYKYEIQNISAIKLNQMIEQLPAETQVVYFKLNPTPTEQEIVDRHNRQLIGELKSLFRETYVDSGLLDAKQLERIAQPCYQAIQT